MMLLEMKDICKDYMQGKEPVRVLKDVSLQVEEGDYLAIMGPSGSGKTTLMNLIGCLDVPTSGTYLLNGEDVGMQKSNKLAQIRNEILGFVFQSFYLLPKLSALDNVALPLIYAGVPKKERRARAAEALKRMGLEDRMKFRPNQLSGGQCQRVAIARAIVTKPKLLLADEPTGALDSASGRQIMDIFDELNRDGVTIVMITHEQEVAARASRICHIRDGVLTGGMPGYEAMGYSRKADYEEDLPVELEEFLGEESVSQPDQATKDLTSDLKSLGALTGSGKFVAPEAGFVERGNVFASPDHIPEQGQDVFDLSETVDEQGMDAFARPEIEFEDAPDLFEGSPEVFDLPDVGDVFPTEGEQEVQEDE